MAGETRKLYDDDPYLPEFEATVIEIDGNNVILDQTAFHPEGGGQDADTGLIGGAEVIDTRFSDGKIVHVFASPPSFKVEDNVTGCLDWNRRNRIMKLHSAAHIMEFFLFRRFGELKRQGSFVDDRKDRADYEYEGRLPADLLKLVEDDANRFLAEGRPITINRDPNKPEIRIWRCDWMEMPCAGTHVHNTSEIGAIRLRRKNPGRGVERIETSLSIDVSS